MMNNRQRAFTLVEMIVVIVITGIIGGMVAMFIRAPVQGYTDSARRAELTDIADTAMRRITRDVRMALPNSVRIKTVGANTYLEFLPTIGGGRYRDSSDGAAGNILNFAAADISFDVLGTMPPVAINDQIVVYNLGIPGADAYAGNTASTHNRRSASGVAGNVISITSAAALPFSSCIEEGGYVVGGCRFQVVQTPVTYVCSPGPAGTLTRWQGYTIQTGQPTTIPGTATTPAPILAGNVSACSITYDSSVAAQRSGLVTIQLTITEQGESVSLYGATHVNNVP